MKPILSTQSLTIGYGLAHRTQKIVAANISASLNAGELVCLIGPNGAGKSTLIRTIVGMQAPLGGVVYLGQEEVHKLAAQELAKRISVVLTDRVDAGSLSAYELVALGRYPYTNWNGRLTQRDIGVVGWALEATRSEELAHRAVSELSDGERQRVMIARALAQEPVIMVLDEPTAFLDLPRRVETMGLLRNLAHGMERAILVATHDLDIALRVADRIWLLPTNGPLTAGMPEELILDGSFERVFESSYTRFDNASGSFKIKRDYHHQVGLLGEGLAALWTARALEREGFEVLNDNGRLSYQVRVVVQGTTTRWQVAVESKEVTFPSLSEAVSAINELCKESPHPGHVFK